MSCKGRSPHLGVYDAYLTHPPLYVPFLLTINILIGLIIAVLSVLTVRVLYAPEIIELITDGKE